MTRQLLTTPVLVAALALGLAACGGDASDPSEEAGAVYEPTDSPSMGVTMIDLPADYSTIEGTGFTIGAPGEFQQQRTQSSNGEPMLVLEKPSEVESLPQRVAIIRDVDPTSSAAEQSFALETAKSAAGPGAEVERSQLPATDEDLGPAYLVTWKEVRPGSGTEDVEVTYWQLFQQAGDDLIINVVALAPSAEFETSEVSRILRTFAVDASAAA
ncbi:hypothetical protein [Nocardioides sp. SYSU DS0663]|uniref:hypothetical protein n=1 Tax=Nocardioides sp. SYSU DS0663 TaxID=3416445 RepID=UPI003F4C4333